MKELGYIALGCVLMLVVMKLRRVNWSKIRVLLMLVVTKLRRIDWSKIRLPKFRWPRFALVPKMKNSLLVSVAVHIVLVFIGSILFVAKDIQHDYDSLTIEWVTMPRTLWRAKKPKLKPVQPRIVNSRNLATHRVTAKPDDMMEAARRSFALVEKSVNLPVDAPEAKMGDAKASTRLRPKSHEVPKTITEHVNAPERDKGKGRLGTKIVEDTGTVDSPKLEDSDFSHFETVPDGQLGAVVVGEGRNISAHIRLIRLKHSLSDWWQDPTAMPSLFKWLRANTRIRADMKFKSGSLRLSDPDIQDAPLIFMTGHDKDITVGRNLAKDGPLTHGFTPAERTALRKYIIDRGGMLFFDDCGFNGLFAQQVALEFDRIFPEYPLKDIPHNHEIYKLYYEFPVPPRGGDVFWSAPGAAQRVGGVYRAVSSKFAYQKGISIGSRLAVVYNRKDYLCSMETGEVDSRASLRNRRSTDVHRFMTNLLVYTLKYGGNVDRSRYKR